MKFLIWISFAVLLACSPEKPQENVPPKSPDPFMEKIDIHAHYRADRDYLIPLLDSLNMTPLLVDVARVDTLLWQSNRQGLLSVYKKYPGHFYFCTAFAANGIDEPDYAEKIIRQLRQDLDQGARMVKVWKNFGMVSRDNSGQFVQIDDPRLQPIWDFLVEQDIPVLAHIGEPLQAWRPLEDDNPHANYYRNHPEYHAYLHPEIPSWETIQEARNNWLARNPRLVVVGAHNGSMSHDVALIGSILDKYPNFHVEPAARFGDLIRQDSDSVRAYFIKYQDRILYGTDLGTSDDASLMDQEEINQEKFGINAMYGMHWQYLTASGDLDYKTAFMSKPVKTRALNLPDSVLRKVYFSNASKILKIP